MAVVGRAADVLVGERQSGGRTRLAERELIFEVGRKQTPGRPILYGTTPAFLHYFGLAALEELPPLPDEEESVEEEMHVALHAAGVEP